MISLFDMNHRLVHCFCFLIEQKKPTWFLIFQHSEQWDSVEVIIEQDRKEQFNPYGYCGEYPVSDVNHITLPKGQRSTVAIPNICLEPDQVYKVRLDFRRFTERPESVPASVLIDSVRLLNFVPHIFFA